MTTLDWIEAFFRFEPEAWKGFIAYSLGSLLTLCVFEYLKKLINKKEK